jgi:hypothetical protein
MTAEEGVLDRSNGGKLEVLSAELRLLPSAAVDASMNLARIRIGRDQATLFLSPASVQQLNASRRQ